MSFFEGTMLALVLALLAYLTVALLKPEWFS